MGDYTWASVYWMYSLMTLFVVGAVFFLIKAVQSGAVADDETPKYRMLDTELASPRDLVHGNGGAHEHQA